MISAPIQHAYRVFCLGLVALILACSSGGSAAPPREYWIWAGILPDAAPTNANLLVYQGNFVLDHGHWKFDHKGIHPFPLKRRELQLVFRMHDLPELDFLLAVVHAYVDRWQSHGVQVSGVQLDFDSPSVELESYAEFLADVRAFLPEAFGFSITGLGAWLAESDPQMLAAVHRNVDYVAYQLYQGRKPLEHPDQYLRFLRHLPHEFKVGLLAEPSRDEWVHSVSSNPSYRGTIFFIQRQ